MATQQFMHRCPKCEKMTMHMGPSTSHVLHLLLSLITVGVWVPVWVIVTASNNLQGQCSECGRRKGMFG